MFLNVLLNEINRLAYHVWTKIYTVVYSQERRFKSKPTFEHVEYIMMQYYVKHI